MKKHTVDVNYFPGWVRKSVTFTIDDGKLEPDRKFLDIVKPAGILGTFNLCSDRLSAMTEEEYRAFYRGYGIANHCKHHPGAFSDGEEYTFTDEPFDSKTADPALVYKTHVSGLYHIHTQRGWRNRADDEGYLRFARESFEELKAVFGDKVMGYVWPFVQQKNKVVVEGIRSAGYYCVRQSGGTRGEDGFKIPEKFGWTYTAKQDNLLALSDVYEAYPDDGELKFFSVGVHSIDYETAGKWDDLREFARRFGNKPEKYFSESVENIFLYADATKEVEITDEYIYNPTEIDLYIKVDGERVTLRAKEKYTF